MLFLIAASLGAACIGISSVLSIEPRMLLDADAYTNEKMPAMEMEAMIRRLRLAGALDPLNPELLESLSRYYELKSGESSVGREADLGTSLSYVEKALRLRPSSPYGWAILLDAKSARKNPDREFHSALSITDRLGPWEPAVQLVEIRAGLDHWSSLNDGEKNVIRNAILRAIKLQPEKVLALLRRNDCGRPGC